MLAALVAASLGWRSVYLGPDLPGAEIALAASRLRAGAIGLSFVFPSDDPAIEQDLAALAAGIDPAVSIFLGGEGLGRLSAAGNPRFHHLGSLAALGRSLTAAVSPA
jgi:hypothetical protein